MLKLIIITSLILLLPSSFSEQVLDVNKKPAHSSTKPTQSTEYSSIYNLVRSADRKHTSQYAHKVTSYIIRYSSEYKVPPALTASVGYVESRFRMSSKPCVGVMQVYLPTYRLMDKHTGLNPYVLEDNIHLGVREMSRYYHKPSLSSRGGNYRLRYTLGRYNGCGPNGKYVLKALSLYKKLRGITSSKGK